MNDYDDVSILAQQIRETNKLSHEDKQLLRTLHVKLKNSPLPQHEIETRAGSRPPTCEEMKKFEEITPVKKGCYNSSEDEIITHNWKEFCMLHNWNPIKVEPFLLLREGNETYIRGKKQRKRFVQFLADGLPNRTLYSVYHRFRNLYAVRFQRRFHPDEDKMILDHLEHNANLDQKRKYTDLAKVLKRTRISIWRRYKLLKKKRRESKKLY
ncbi:uncharacterized protein LOC122527279 [Frieseomelitta varia]|uniref:uncharacterized protein LOC122527279 n=1 Tax=Frieseomelitta varia TaxID=561572 RepID=UPI001CB6B4F9|nr:uncharacterized protein LOC122527279 [Frieseomelitta varia]XP_043507236.1 uncharacterized protein LOC122527279 [Frieseomelitta varia]